MNFNPAFDRFPFRRLPDALVRDALAGLEDLDDSGDAASRVGLAVERASDGRPPPLALRERRPSRFARRRFDDLRFEEAVERARLGDASAFDIVASEFAGPLVRYTASILSGDCDAAHDVVQEVLLAAWRSLPEMAEPRFLRAWMFRVAQRRAVSYLRQRRAIAARLCPIEERGVDGHAMPARPEGASGGREAEAARALRRMLADIPHRYASAMALCYLDGLGVRETARVLDLSLSSLKMRLHRGRWLLKRRLVVEEDWAPHTWGRRRGRRVARREGRS